MSSQAGQLLGVVLLASLPIWPPLVGKRPQTVAFWLSHAFLVGLIVGVYYVNARVGVPRLLFRGHMARYLLLIGGLVLGVLGLGQWAIVRRPPLPGAAPAAGPDQRLPGPGLRAGPDAAPNADPEQDPGFDPDAPDQPTQPAGPTPGQRHTPAGFDLIIVLTTALVIGAGTQAAVVRRGQLESELRQALEQEKLKVELSYLKAQLNPHFFFNTLNNIYALTEIDVDKARQALYKLSRIMRYVLYQTQETTVLLSQELLFMQDYVGLMHLRLNANMQVEFTHPDQLDDRPIAPLLLLPFIENAFKYGVSTGRPATILIALEQPPGALELTVRNQVFTPHRSGLAEGSGIGLANTRRRLALLYPGRHTLTITERNAADEFVIHLSLLLT